MGVVGKTYHCALQKREDNWCKKTGKMRLIPDTAQKPLDARTKEYLEQAHRMPSYVNSAIQRRAHI